MKEHYKIPKKLRSIFRRRAISIYIFENAIKFDLHMDRLEEAYVRVIKSMNKAKKAWDTIYEMYPELQGYELNYDNLSKYITVAGKIKEEVSE